MPRALVVERSATLRRSLERRLLERAFDCELATTPERALETLEQSGERFDLILLGWPDHLPQSFSRLLGWLECNTEQPLLLFSDHMDPERHHWAARRPHCSLLIWNQIDRLHDVLDAESTADTPFGLTEAPATAEPIRIVLVDDSRTVRKRYTGLLQRHGYDVMSADNVANGFDLACENSFDIAIIDYFMPDDTGDALCLRMREDPRTSRILCSILTGSYRDNIIQDGLQAGAIEVMFKNEAEALFLARVEAMRNTVLQRRGLRHRQRHLEGILNAVGEGVYGVDNQGRLTFMNPTARRLLDLEGCQLQGCEPREMFHYAGRNGKSVDAETCFLTAAYGTGESIRQWETVFWSRNGRCVPVEGTILPLRIDDRRRGSVVAFRDVSEQEKLQRELLFQANHDALTGLYNRGHFEEQVNQEIQRVQRTGDCSALVFIDLDRFKHVNDTAGHAAGDLLLQEVAALLGRRLRGSDSLGRMGGDEFAILLRNVEPDELRHAADAFRQLLVDYDFNHEESTYSIAGSIGVTQIDTAGDSLEEAMARADHASRIAKESGRNQTHLFRPEDDRRGKMHQELGWTQRLTAALEDDGFELYQQATIWCEETTHTPAIEILLRLVEHDRITRPHAFLSAAERFGLAEAIDCWVLEQTIQRLAEASDTPLAWVNLTASSLIDEALPQQLLGWLERYGVSGDRLGIEIDEGTALRYPEDIQRLAVAIGEQGVRLGLDNFGASLGSFSRLKQLPVEQIKLDSDIISAIANDTTQQAILKAATQVARTLGIRTIAKHVENAETAGMAQRCGVDGMQGEHLAAPANWSRPDAARSSAS